MDTQEGRHGLNIEVNVTDRSSVIAAMERFTHQTAVCAGPPSFKYIVGDYAVLRNGNIECSDNCTEGLIRFMQENGFLQRPQESECISIPYPDSRAVVNVINTLFTRGPLINKAFSISAFHVDEELVNMLRIEKPSTTAAVLGCVNLCGSEALQGISVNADSIEFIGFNFVEETAKYNTARCLSQRIVHTASTKKWIKAERPEVINEKYSFRVWLNTIGMVGNEYQMERKILLQNLAGDISFRLPEQKLNFYKNRRTARKEHEEEFILL